MQNGDTDSDSDSDSVCAEEVEEDGRREMILVAKTGHVSF